MSETKPAPGGWTFDSLPDWVQQAVRSSTAAPAFTASSHRGKPEWPLLLEASLVAGFLPRDLAPEAVDETTRAQAESVVLQCSETTHAAGDVRWSVTRDARRSVLREALRTGEVRDAIRRTAGRFADPVTTALRELLTGATGEGADAPLEVLEARRAAVSLLAGIPGLTLPSVESLDRRIEFRRLVAQFERMIGGAHGADRFFGRRDEREQLNAYVDVVGASTITSAAQRLLNRAVRQVTGRAPLSLWGVGGVGKTSLLCKFMLEHIAAATADGSRFPFVYLDFDRVTVSARNRAGLLMEMCLQVGTQFEQLSAALDELHAKVAATARRMASRPEGDSMELLAPCVSEFRALLDATLAEGESMFGRERPFLLVFDTFEVAQYTRDDVRRLEEFVSALHGTRPWSRLRLIISGRQKAEAFLGGIEELPLRALDPAGSREMLARLAADASKPIADHEAGQLVAAVARAGGEPGGGVHPLRLRLIGNIFSQMKESGPEIVRILLHDLEQPPDSRSITGQILVDGVLVRRVLGHVADPRVRALADPGLVVRRITPAVIQQVMARGTPAPSAAPPSSGQPDARPSWDITEAEAEDIFRAFKREVSLVEPDGDALRHRADVRLQMLPLIRARSRARFDRLHTLAYDFFNDAVRRDPGDWASLAEAIYHGLWAGVSLEDIDRMWRREASFEPRINENDFPDDSLAHLYLRAKGQQNLTPGEVRRLPTDVALTWLEKRGSDLLGERRVDGAVQIVSAIGGEHYAALDRSPSSAALAGRLLYRAGLWNDAAVLLGRHLEQPGTGPPMVSMLRTLVTIEAKSQMRPRTAPQGRIAPWLPSLPEPMVRVELLAHDALAGARQSELSDPVRQAIGGAMQALPADRWRRDTRILRLGIVTGVPSREHVVAYAEQCDRLPRDVEATPRLAEEIASVDAADGTAILDEVRLAPPGARGQAYDKLDAFWRRHRRPLLQAIDGRLPEFLRLLVVFDHADWHGVLGNALTMELERTDGALGHAIQAARDDGPAAHLTAPPGDGQGIVKDAVAAGQLLPLARHLAGLESTFARRQAEPGYPQDVYGIANSLLRWHDTIMRLMPGAVSRGATRER